MVEVKQKWQIICPVAMYIYIYIIEVYTQMIQCVNIYIYIHTRESTSL